MAPAAVLSPVTGGITIAALGAVLYGGSNLIQVARKKKGGKQAAIDSVKDTVGIGIAGGLGLAAAGAIGVLSSTVFVPAAVGIGVTVISKKVWNRIVSRHPKSKS